MLDQLPEWAQNKWMLGFALASGMSAMLGLFARLCPKKKLIEWVKPPCIGLGKTISKLLVVRLGKKAAERFEEGILVTVLQVAGEALLFIVQGLVHDNAKRKK